MQKIFLTIVLVFIASAGFAQLLHVPNGYMLVNLSSEKCKFWATTTRSLSNINTQTGKFETVVYNESFVSANDTASNIFNDDYLNYKEFPELRLNGFVYNFDKMDLSKEFRQTITLRGVLYMHGIKKDVEYTGNIYNRPQLMMLDYELYVDPNDFSLKAPANLASCISPLMLIKGNVQLVDMSKE